MAVRDWLPFSRRKDNPVASLIVLGLGYSDQLIPPKVSLAVQSRDGYEASGAVFTCVNLLATSCAGIPWVLYRRPRAGAKPQKVMTARTALKAWRGNTWSQKAVRNAEITDHPVLTLIERPNPLQGGSAYTEAVMAYLLINGNSYETWVGPETGENRGRPMELWPMRPDRVIIRVAQARSGELVGAYQYRVGTSTEDFDPALVLHQKFFSPLDDLYGLSPIKVAAHTIDGDVAAALWNHRLLANDARPPAALIVKHRMQPDDRDRTKKDLEERYSGPHNARRPLVLEGDVDWKTLAANPADLDWIQGRKLNAREIANVYGVPAEFVDMESVSYASKEQARKGLYQERILPLMDRRRDALNNSAIVKAWGDDLYLDYDRDQIEALHDDTNKLYAGLRQADWLSIQDKRAATGYDDYTGDPETDNPVDVPVAFLKPSALPGAPQDTGDPGARTTPASVTEPGAAPGIKSQDLTDDMKVAEAALVKKLDAHFRDEAKALGAHLRRTLG